MRMNIFGELRLMKDLNIKPNFSALQREYNIDRHTIKKYYDLDGKPLIKKRNRSCKWDAFYEEIASLLEKPSVSYKAAYMFLYNKYGDSLPGDYDSMRNYLYYKGHRYKSRDVAHPLYEVNPGQQLQFDFKENLSITLKTGEVVKFNVFSATLGYSRYHVFIYSPNKTTDDVLRCLIETYRRLGGVSKTAFTDNMSAIVSIKNGKKRKHSKVIQFFKDLDVDLQLAERASPETKGKDENANKYMNWLAPYEGELESENDLIKLIEETITSQCNQQINTGTGIPPIVLFNKEKEYLHPMPNNILLESYLEEYARKIVPPTLLITYKGRKYSVPQEYINKAVDIYPISDCLYIYYNKKLVAKHTISQNKVNYDKKHYKDALANKLGYKDKDEIEKMATENLKRLGKVGNIDEF